MKIAMIGSGGIAARHLQTLTSLDDVRIVGHVARTRGSSELAARRWGGRAYDDVESLLAHEAPDAVWITVPPDAHGAIEEHLIDAGVPFLVEKPLSHDRETAARVGARLEESGTIAAVGYQWRASDVLDEVRDALRSHPVRLVQGTWHGLLPPPTWWREEARSGGQMVEQATHLLDLARSMVGEAEVLHAVDAHRDRPESDVPGVASATLRFRSGALGVVTAANVLDRAEDVALRLVCDGLHVSLQRDRVTFASERERRTLRRRGDPILEQNRAFLAAVRSGEAGRAHAPYEDALRTHHLAFDVLDAAIAARGHG